MTIVKKGAKVEEGSEGGNPAKESHEPATREAVRLALKDAELKTKESHEPAARDPKRRYSEEPSKSFKEDQFL